MAAEQVYIAQVDIPVPGEGAMAGISAFRAGEQIPSPWVEQHQAWFKDQEAAAGAPLVKAVPAAKAVEAAAQATERASGQPQPVTPTVP